MAALAAQLGALSLGSRSRTAPASRPRASALLAAPRLSRPADRRALVVVAAQNADRRQRRIERETEYNKVFLDRIKSSTRASIKGYRSLLADKGATVSSEADLKPVDAMMGTAFSWIDKAVTKGVLHKNTAARRKSKITNVRKTVMQATGLYTPE
jgi:small subunit ribosomal protein S20